MTTAQDPRIARLAECLREAYRLTLDLAPDRHTFDASAFPEIPQGAFMFGDAESPAMRLVSACWNPPYSP